MKRRPLTHPVCIGCNTTFRYFADPPTDDTTTHYSHGLCSRCTYRKTVPNARPRRGRDGFIREYLGLWESGIRDDELIAKHMGIKVNSMRDTRSRIRKAVPLPSPSTKRFTPPPECVDCEAEFGDELSHYKHGRCGRCAYRHEHPNSKPTRRRSEFVAEYLFLWETGIQDDRALARRLGMKLDSMQQARRRAIKAGAKLPLIVTDRTIYY